MTWLQKCYINTVPLWVFDVTSGVHSGARLCSRWGSEVSCSGREGGARQWGEGGPLPRHALSHGEAGGPKGLPSIQGKQWHGLDKLLILLHLVMSKKKNVSCSPFIAANCVWLRSPPCQRTLLRLWCQRFQFCEELDEVLWRLCQDPRVPRLFFIIPVIWTISFSF